MTKRNNKFEDYNNKKRKLADDIEALWDDGLDESAFDDCIKLATQVLEEKPSSELNTPLPTYNVFKEPKIFCSTQLDSSIRPSTSRHIPLSSKRSHDDLERESHILRLKYEEKEGEVSILRTQLNETKHHYSLEQQKIQNEWNNKMSIKEKEVQTVKSELQFKNLEIANLKQRLTDVVKRNVSFTQIATENKIVQHKENLTEVPKKQIHLGHKLYTSSTTVYPLQGTPIETFFAFPTTEKHVIDTKLTNSHRNAIPYLQNQTVATKTIVDKSNINVDIILPAVFHLIKCSEDELNQEENFNHINMIICGTLQYIMDLSDFLEEIKCNLRTEDILEVDANYLKNCSYFTQRLETSPSSEFGVKAAIFLNFVAELINYSDYLRIYISEGKNIRYLSDDSFSKHFQNIVKKQSGHDFLNRITKIIHVIGEIRRSDIMSQFLNASIKLFINISKKRNYNYVSDIFCKFTMELIFSRPLCNVVFKTTYLFKEASQYPSFVNFLLNKSKTSITDKRGVVYFNNDACRFYIYVLLFDNCINNLTFLPLDVTLNMLCFMYNTYKSSYWIHHQNIKECNCLQQLYKLEMEIVFRALEKYTEEVKRTKQKTSQWRYFFENKITSKILNLMMFHSDELTEKYITVFSQYKEIEKQLQEENLCDLSTLNISEDIPQMGSASFDNLDF